MVVVGWLGGLFWGVGVVCFGVGGFVVIDFYFDYQGDFPGFDTWKIALVMIVFVDVHRSVTILNTICQTSETIKIYI